MEEKITESLKREGDINISEYRKIWQKKNISKETQKILDDDSSYFIHQSLSTPCLNVVKSVNGIYIEDTDGRKYMDFHGNSLHQLGYNNEDIVESVKRQMEKLSFSPRRYTNETAVKLAEKLCTSMGEKEYKTLFTTSGAASMSIALKLARKYTGNYKTISLWDSFHGATLDTISIGGESVFRKNAGPLMPGTEHIMPYNSYRCMFGSCGQCQLKCLDYLEYIIEREGDICAVIMETVRSTDVQIPPVEYYKRLREICSRYNTVMILDEIPTALGRTGKMFAFQNYGIEPDILVIGKGLGGGLIPMSAVIADKKMDICQDSALGHFTHEKNPLGSAAALALIEKIENDEILNYVRKMGRFFLEKLTELYNKYEKIGDIRVIGLMGAVELVKNRDTKEKAAELAEKIMYRCLDKGLSFKVSQGNVLTLMPPLIITKEELSHAVILLDEAFSEELSGDDIR